MSIMTRIIRLWKADVHGVMDQLEDKELLLKQYLREMENSLQNKKNQLQNMAQTIRNVQRDLLLRREEMAALEKDLELALRKEKDDIARLLIRKQKAYQSSTENQQRYLKELEEDKHNLVKLLEEQRLQYDSLKARTAAYCSRAERQRFHQETTTYSSPGEDMQTYDEEEIELELMRRKEALEQKEGAA